MTAYTAYANTAGPLTLSIAPVTYPVRLAKVDGAFVQASGITELFAGSKFLTSTLTGGTAVTPVALRDGAPAPTATVKSAATASGTQRQLFSQITGGSTSGVATTYQFPFDCIIAPGNVFQLSIAAFSGSINNGTLLIHFEELRLNWSQ